MNEPHKPLPFDFGASVAGESSRVNLDAGKSGVSADPASTASTEASAHIDEVRKGKRGRRSNAEIEVDRERAREELSREFATLFDPEQWGAICRGPADLMLHLSKRDLWRIEDRELKPLAVGAAHTARLFIRSDPKWIALIMFSVSMMQIYGARIALHIAQSKKEERERARQPATDKPAALKTV